MLFKDLGICSPILKALHEQGYSNPTPIQQQSIPLLLNNKDLLGCAQTGTGKTAAFTIPILQHLYNSNKNRRGKSSPSALIITPTRELAIQINDNIKAYSKYTGAKSVVIFGGVKQHTQTKSLRHGTDILVATPGRLLDLMGQGFISLRFIKYFVLDEADQMLDMGFINDIKKVLAKLPSKRQSLFFSATLSRSIIKLSEQILGNPEKVTIEPNKTTAEKVDQYLYLVSKSNKSKLLINLLKANKSDSVLVFSRTKHGADKIVKVLSREQINAAAIHGNKSQNRRQKTLNDFKNGSLSVLIATDIAARGIDVDDLSLVVNYDLPNVPETYVHRIGRTGRAQASGRAISFCSIEEHSYLRDIQQLINKKIEIVSDHPFVEESQNLKGVQVPPKSAEKTKKKKFIRGNSHQNKSSFKGNRKNKQNKTKRY
ncbi:MAG: DEAD/DEAH box helicase [Flavobacteriaceae bacterium]|nr:DEAD/DEAH box helicase [Flavobacteriaceae bacterium]